MFEQTNRLAEKLATSVSRRGFLGSLGGWAAAAALGVAGMLCVRPAYADNKHRRSCCFYTGATCGLTVIEVVGSCKDNPCPPPQSGCTFYSCKPAGFTGCTIWTANDR